jgi:hypothetical protein
MAKTRALINKKTFAFIMAMTVVTAGSWASDLLVKAGAAKAGSFGLEVTVGSTCSGAADFVVPDQTVGGTTSFEGCLTLTAANVDVLSSGNVTLRAGDSIAIDNGFSVASSAQLTLTIDQALTGRAYVQDNSPSAEQLYRARFYVDLSSLSPGSLDTFDHFTAFAGSGAVQFDLRLEDSGANIALVASARDGVSVSSVTADSSLPSTYFAIEFEWKASDTGLSNGHLDVWVDGTPVTGLSGLDNETGQIDFVRWGAVDGVDSTTSGTMNLDEFVSQRSSSMIGTLP